MKRVFCGLLALLCLTLPLCGCTPEEPVEESSAFDPVSYEALPGIDLSTMLAVEQVAQGLNVAAEDLDTPYLYDDGGAVRYSTRDYTLTMDIALQRLSDSVREYALETCAGFTVAPNLGDAAYFDESSYILYVFFDNFLLNVTILQDDMSPSTALSLSRHFAALVLEQL